LDLLAISYQNIWPFKDKIINIFFDKGKFLIKAPIGSGKSFLFFDGPVYALYKNTGRNVLNVDSKNWFIKLLFEINGQKYLIVRNLTKWPVKDSCTSQLFLVHNLIWEVSKESDQDIHEILKKTDWVNLEEITFKNERDLEWNLSTILPPREAFLSTMFLLQDSENIFELQAAERLTVMKNIFNLIWIDEIKDQIANKRRDIQTTLKVKSDTSNYDLKIKNILQNLIQNFKKIDIPETDENLKTALSNNQELIQERELIADNINIDWFSVQSFDKNLNTELNSHIWKQKSSYQEFFVKLQHTQEQIKNKQENIKILNNDLIDFQKQIENFDKQIENINPEIIDNKKKEKINLLKETDKILDWVNLQHDIPNEIHEFISKKPNDIEDWNNLVIELTTKWQDLANQKKNTELMVQNKKLKIKSENEKKEIEIKNLNETQETLKNNLNNIVSRINNLNKSINEEAQYKCSQINDFCPFIKEINKQTFQELEKQKESFEKEKQELESKIAEIQERIQNNNKINPDQELEQNSIENLENEIKKIEESINNLKIFFTKIEFKKIQETYNQRKNIQTEISKLDKGILQLEESQKWLENIKEEKIKLEQKIENNKQESKKLELELENLNKLEQEQKQKLESFDIQKIQELENLNKNIENNIRDLEILINDFKSNQLEIKWLQEDEKLVKNLYQIFSKELMLYVLEWYLPILTDIINSFLAQVVDYTIDIKLLQKWDSLEMDVKVYDDKWERDIKALSGWQRVILKLVRMLAISSYTKSPILFLDETINNLDVDTVWKVADMLNDFVKQRELKLYTVTHSQQIQEMDIWDEIIDVYDYYR
jgi:DNA repair exonuclease SbcCD ATPase subunit